MNTYRYGIVMLVILFLSACGGGGGGGGNASSANATLVIAIASDAPPARVISGTAYQEVFAFTVESTGNTVPVSSVSISVNGDTALLSALTFRLTESDTPIGTTQQTVGGQAMFLGLSANVAAGTKKRFALEAAVTGNVSWNTGERTKKVSFSVSHGDVVPGGTSFPVAVVGSAQSSPMYRERGRIVFPRGVQVDYGGSNGIHWSHGNNIWIGNLETLTADIITNDIGDTGGGGGISFPYIRFGMTPSPSFDRIAFSFMNNPYTSVQQDVPYSIKTDGTGLVFYAPEVCNSTPARETAYAPNGNFLVYRTICHQTSGNWKSDIVAVRTDGSFGFKITSDEREDYSPVVSADGTAVYFLSCEAEGSCKVYVVGVNFAGGYATESPRVLTGNDWNWLSVAQYPAAPGTAKTEPTEGTEKRWLSLSPDGKKLLVVYKKNNSPDRMGIYDLASSTMTDVGAGSAAYFAADGRIVFLKPWWPDWQDRGDGSLTWKQWDSSVPLYYMEGDGSDVREMPVEICLRANWDSCAFGLPLLPPS